MKQSFFTLSVAAILFVSCNNDDKNSPRDRKFIESKSIKDDRLYSFMLGGAYFFDGFGGMREVEEHLFQGRMTYKPGDNGFIKELHSVYSDYFIFPYRSEERSRARLLLASYWNMTSAVAYREGMESLINHGHQEHFQQTLMDIDAGKTPNEWNKESFNFVKNHRSEFTRGGIKSWDIARYVNNIASGYAAGYVTKAEAETMLEKIPAIARNAYTNWEEYWEGFRLGRRYWGGGKESDAAFDKEIKEMQEGDYSIYKYMAFK